MARRSAGSKNLVEATALEPLAERLIRAIRAGPHELVVWSPSRVMGRAVASRQVLVRAACGNDPSPTQVHRRADSRN